MQQKASCDAHAVDLSAKVAFLRRPEIHGDHPAEVEAVETHMAWVFLTRRYAYKLKKPVHYGMLDFSTLEARQHDSEEEVRLNRRLAPDVYLGVVPLTLDNHTQLQLGAHGYVVDWLVAMRRLPRRDMLETVINEGRATQGHAEAVGRLLADFYEHRAAIVPMIGKAYRQQLHDDLQSTWEELRLPRYELPRNLLDSAGEHLLQTMDDRADLLDARAQQDRIVDGHGDLRPEHVCLRDERPVIIDCLEFNRALRILDAASELAFLSLECRRLGAEWVGEQIFHHYCKHRGDRLPEPLWHFYQGYHAFQRAKVAVWHTLDHVPDPQPWQDKADDYLKMIR